MSWTSWAGSASPVPSGSCPVGGRGDADGAVAPGPGPSRAARGLRLPTGGAPSRGGGGGGGRPAGGGGGAAPPPRRAAPDLVRRRPAAPGAVGGEGPERQGAGQE